MNCYAQSQTPFYTKAKLAEALAVQATQGNSLLGYEGVQGVGIGAKDGSLAIVVLVDEASREAQLPSTLDGTPVSVRVVGTIHATPCGGSNPQDTYPLPVPLGVSGGNAIMVGDCCASGTIGFKVRDNATGSIGWISNSHVVGHGSDGCPGTAPVGTTEYQPGPIDTSCGPAQNIGSLSRVVPIVFGGADNVVDAGFVLSSDAAVSGDILNLGPQVDNAIPAFVGQTVRKNGRTSGCTEGTVTAINMTINVDYSESGPCTTSCGIATFTNQVMFSPTASSTTMGDPGDSGSPVVDANNNAVALLFAGDMSGNGFGNPMEAVLAALNVTLSGSSSTQDITRTSRFWFTHAFGTAGVTNCVDLLDAINLNGGALDLGFVSLPTTFYTGSSLSSTDTLLEALGFYWKNAGRTGENGGTQSQKLPASALCKQRKQLAVEFIAATANVRLLGTEPQNATYVNGSTVTNFPGNLLAQARAALAGEDPAACQAMTLLLRKFNQSGVANNYPDGLVECSPVAAKTLRSIAHDPTTQASCPGINNSCESAEPVALPTCNPLAGKCPKFSRTVSLVSQNFLNTTNTMPAPLCDIGGPFAVWKITPDVGVNNRHFTADAFGSNFRPVLAVWSGGCESNGSNLVSITCNAGVPPFYLPQVGFSTDGSNTFFIVAEGATGSVGRLKFHVTSP